MRTVLAFAAMLALTFFFGLLIICAALVGITPKPNGFLEGLPRRWTRLVLGAAGSRVRLHSSAILDSPSTHVYVSNHVSWFDVFALASILPRFRFVAKKELSRLPIFGKAAGAVAAIYIDRNNRKAAFEGYRAAAEEIRGGVNVAVYPEGTRGHSYA
ncbi:MAG: 1-acyl-sn-glycerol-3-phosphate acyltransferase, partial [Gemmatimonadota bacterium]|nr:1-acyl-sn-glycerol-3-phosphate acyltransferase [Gemmatimonadota bacterium]